MLARERNREHSIRDRVVTLNVEFMEQLHNIGGHNEKQNIEVVHTLCALLDELRPDSANRPHAGLITNVQDRPGDDQRYAIDASEIQRGLGWTPEETFEPVSAKRLNGI